MKNRSIKLTAIAVAMFLSAQGTFADADVTDFSSLIDAISTEVAQPAIINLKNDITWETSRQKPIKLGDNIKSDITINGGYNADNTPYTITGSNHLGFDVQPSTNLYLNDIGLKNFISTGWGGAIYNEGTMRLKNVTFSNNQGNNIGVGGGAIANYGSGLASLTGNMNFIQNSANGKAPNGGGVTINGQGGAIYNSGTLSIRNNAGEKAVFTSNKANKNGGAIYNTTGANSTGRMTLAGNFEFDSNHADNAGGAIYNNGYMSLVGDYVFKGNTANSGGAMYNDRGNLVLSGTRAADGNSTFVFSDNKSDINDMDKKYGGGALYVTGSNSGSSYLDITGVDFKNNTSWARGGAIYLENNVDFNIIDSHFTGNKNTAGETGNAYGWGGAIGLGNGHIEGYVENSIFDSNIASDAGGVIATNTALTFVNSKFYNNSAGYSGGAISYNPNGSSSGKYLKLIADGADTVFAGNNVTLNHPQYPSSASKGQEGLFIGNFLTDFAENDSNVYFNTGNSGSLIFNDIVNATGLSLDDVREGHKNPNKNIQLNQSGITYGKLDPASNASDIANAPTDGTIVFNNTVRGANLVLHNGTLTFGQKNSYGSYVAPDKYFTDDAKITLKGGTLDLMNGSIESGDKFAPSELNVLNNANLRLDLNLTINNDGTLGGNIDMINSPEIKGSDSATLTIDKLSFNDVVIPAGIDKDSILGKSVILQFANKNSVNTELEQSLTTVITSNAGYNLELATAGENSGKNALQITQVVNAGGLPVAVSSGQNGDLTSSRTYIYNATADEEIGGATNAWNKGYNVFVTGNETTNDTIIHRNTSNVLKGDTLQINGNGKNIFTTSDAVGIALGVEGDGTQQSLIINDVKKVDEFNNFVGWNGFNSAIINNGGVVKLGNSIFSSNKSTATEYIDYVADASVKIQKSANGGAVQNNSGELYIENTSFLNNSAEGFGGAIYNKGTTYINATDEQNVNFEGNTATLGGNDIYNLGNLILSTTTSGKITFNGGIGGDSSNLGNIYLGKDTTQNLGSVVLNNTISNQNIFLNSGTLKLGEKLSTPFENVNLTLNGGSLDAVNGKIDEIKVNDLTISSDNQSSYLLDINLGVSNDSDKIELSGTLTQGDKNLKLGPLNFLNSTQISDSGYYTDFINNSNIKAEIDAANKIVTVDGATYQVDINGNRISITKVGASGGFAYELIDSDPMKSARTYNVVNDEDVTAWIGGNNYMAGSQFYIYGAKNGKYINGTGLQGINVAYTNDGDPQELDIVDVSSYKGFNSAVINNGGDVVISGTTFEDNNATSTGNNGNGGVIQNNGGNVNIGVNTVFQNNTAENLGGAIYNGANGTLNFDAALGKDITFTNNTDKNGANDIYSEGIINFEGTGTITFDGGIAGKGTIESYGNLVLNGDNSNYKGKFDSQVDTNGSAKTGNITVGTAAKFFGGKSNINSGKLNWLTSNDLADDATLIVKNANLVVGNGTDNAQLSIKGSSSVKDATTIVVNNNSNLCLVGQTMTVGALSGNGRLTADNSKLTFDSNSGITTGFTSNSSDVTITDTDLTKSDTLLGTILGGANSGLGLNLNNVTTSKDFTIDSTNITKLNTSGTTSISGAINQGGSFNNVGTLNVDGKFTNTSSASNSGSMTLNEVALDGGKFTNSGTLDLKGAVTGTAGELINSANSTINLKADGSKFIGNLISSGIINADKSDYLFGGNKLINAGELNINSGAVNYDKISLGSSTKLNHTIDSTNVGAINSATFKFADGASNANASFTTTNGVTSNLNLSKIDNGLTNNISISNSNVTLIDTDYKGGTIYNLKDSTLNLIENHPDEKFNNYEFNNLKTDNVTLNFNVKLNRDDNGNSLITDTLKTDNSSIFKIGKLYISGEENGQRGEYKTTNNVLQENAKFVTSPSTIDDNMQEINGATSSWIYKVSLDGDQSIKMEIIDYSDNNTLNNMNKLEGKRFFQFSENDTRIYEIAKSLEPTATGDFFVDGANNSSNILSGGGSKSFFNIAQSDKNTNLNITNITIENANKTGNGSVIENNSTNATINITGSTIKNNHSTGDGGAIYNGAKKADNSANLIISNTIFEGNSADGNGGAIYNAGNMTIKDSEFKAGTDSAKNDIYMADSSSLGFEGNNIIANAISSESDDSTITNSGNLTITETGDAYKYLGEYTQNSGTTTVRGDFFGGNSEISGRLNWFTEEETNNSSKITIKEGAELIIGEDEDAESSLYLKTDSIIEDGANVIINKNSDLRLEDSANVTLNNENNGIAWLGTINQNSSSDTTLTLKGLDGNGLLSSLGGNLNIESGKLYIYDDSFIQEATKVNIANDASLIISDEGSVELNGQGQNTDIWNGTVKLFDGGKLYAGGFDKNGKLYANGGNLYVSGGKLNIGNESFIGKNTVVGIDQDSELNITDGGEVYLNSDIDDPSKDDTWGGTITLNGGNLILEDFDNTSIQGEGFDAIRGALDIKNSTFNMYNNFTVAEDVDVNLFKDSTVIVNEGAELNLDGEDYWGGNVRVNGGDFIGKDLLFEGKEGETWQQLEGSSTFKNSYIELNNEDSYIFGGDLNLINSSMAFGANSISISADNLYMKDSEISLMNNLLEEHEIDSTMNVNGTNHFGIDVAPRAGHLGASDIFFADEIISDSNGTINIADFNFVGLAPIDRQLKFRVFDANSISDNVKFTATKKEIFTPIGYYNIQSAGGGWFTSNMTRYNPQVFRGQVATLASYNNQLVIDDMLLNHVTLDSERLLAQGRNANTYASTLPQFAPYQYKKEDGGLWYKSYVTFENLSLTQGLKVGNNAYGSLVGADFPVMKLKHGWRFMPTAYIGYNGAHQTFNGVGMYQNGGQGGLMGTFMKDDFIGSIVAYGGGYNNEMSVAGYTDKSGNWFAGTAAKLAYNFHPTKYFTIQPTAFMSYNIFGKQHWGTDFGSMSMNSGLMNGINVAPGLNFIYARESWSVYATFQYMYNINDQVGGRAGNVDLASVEMKHGYIQYGLGVTKTWKDRLNSFLQIVFRNGGRTGVGFQLGLNYNFDWKNPFSSKSKTKAKAKSKTIKQQQKTSYQTKGNKTVLKSLSMK